MSYILSIDQGTTGTTAVLINADSLEFIDKVNCEFTQHFPKPGWVEHDLNDIWNTIKRTITDVLTKNSISSKDIKCIGITNQRETTCAFNKAGQPLAKAIVWQDRRTSSFCESLSSKENYIKEKTGLKIDSYFSGTKMRWLLNHNDAVKMASKNDDLLFGTIDTFILYKLTGNTSHKTEASNASRTLLMDLKTCQWDNELLELFEVPKTTLPSICDSFSNFGHTQGLDFLDDGIQISGILGDQQSALFGQAGLTKGDMKCTYGTGAFMLLNTGNEIKYSNNGLLTTVAYKENGKAYYALEGSTYICGAAVQWLRDNLHLFKNSSDIEGLAAQVKDLSQMEHVMFLPFFTGIGSPQWNSEAKAAIVGLTRDTSDKHIARACLDGMCLSINDLITAMSADTGHKIDELRVDGGAVANDLLMTIQATVSDLKIIRPRIIETTAYGAALAAAIGSKIIDKSKVLDMWKEDKFFQPKADEIEHYKMKKEKWSKIIKTIY
ncbi:glycerol kinase GlpK [Halobacteriovorax sp. HLS]|uniref:glycerol kinase GlpK n=1 Tax=Halobacteriovorax sp. HLS TaxID=2234000 RepID=UPI000FD79696|nr:glycerol kinase GlpK [Halobacteriovorax sp. HLS]